MIYYLILCFLVISVAETLLTERDIGKAAFVLESLHFQVKCAL